MAEAFFGEFFFACIFRFFYYTFSYFFATGTSCTGGSRAAPTIIAAVLGQFSGYLAAILRAFSGNGCKLEIAVAVVGGAGVFAPLAAAAVLAATGVEVVEAAVAGGAGGCGGVGGGGAFFGGGLEGFHL